MGRFGHYVGLTHTQRCHALAVRPGKPYPAAFGKLKLRVDRKRIEPFSPILQGSVTALEHASPFHSEVRPGIETGLRPYRRRVLPQHLQGVRFSDHGWNRTIGLLLVTQAS